MNVVKMKIASAIISEELDNLEDNVVLCTKYLSDRIEVFADMLEVDLDDDTICVQELAEELLVLFS